MPCHAPGLSDERAARQHSQSSLHSATSATVRFGKSVCGAARAPSPARHTVLMKGGPKAVQERSASTRAAAGTAGPAGATAARSGATALLDTRAIGAHAALVERRANAVVNAVGRVRTIGVTLAVGAETSIVDGAHAIIGARGALGRAEAVDAGARVASQVADAVARAAAAGSYVVCAVVGRPAVGAVATLVVRIALAVIHAVVVGRVATKPVCVALRAGAGIQFVTGVVRDTATLGAGANRRAVLAIAVLHVKLAQAVRCATAADGASARRCAAHRRARGCRRTSDVRCARRRRRLAHLQNDIPHASAPQIDRAQAKEGQKEQRTFRNLTIADCGGPGQRQRIFGITSFINRVVRGLV